MRQIDIMVIEDSDDLLTVWSELFAGLGGFKTRLCNSGEAAMESLVKDGSPDIIMTDYFLPDINGMEIIKEARKMRPDLPCILATGNRDSAMLREIELLKNARYLRKPVRFKDLEQTISELLAPVNPTATSRSAEANPP